MKYIHDRMPQGPNQQQANAQSSHSRVAAPYRLDGALSQQNAANQKAYVRSVSLPGVNEFLAGAPAEPPVGLPPFSSLFIRPPAQSKPAPANSSGSQARVTRAQDYGERDCFASANTVMPAQQPGKLSSANHSLRPLGVTISAGQRLPLPRPSAIPLRLIPEPNSRLPNFSANQANDFWAHSDGAPSASSVAGTVAPIQQTKTPLPAPSRVQPGLISLGATGKVVKGRPGRPSNATRQALVDPKDYVFSRSSNARLVDHKSGEDVLPDTPGAIPYNKFMADRPVNLETGEIVRDATENTVKFNTYKKRLLVDEKTGVRLKAHQQGGIPYGRFLGKRLVDPATGKLLRVNPETGDISEDVAAEEKLRAITYTAYRSRLRRQISKRAQ
jgi:hypothetical protein